MRIESNNNVRFTSLRVNSNDNKGVKFLYNKVSDIIREHKSPAVFTRDYIDIGNEDKGIIKRLIEEGIKFFKNE